jgi:Family of unknown function (DUF6084)
MVDLNFHVEKAEVEPFAASPLLVFKLRVSTARPVEAVHAVALRCQIRIEPTRRPYAEGERQPLADLFGEPKRWGQTLRSMLWAHANVMVPSFTGSREVDLPVPCTYDFNVATAKYFYALEEGDVPLCLLFSGTIFYPGDDGALQVSQISWEKETQFRLPVRTWREMMDHYYPNCAWLSLRKDIFDRLYRYKVRHGLPTWEEAFEKLLPVAEVQA